MGNRRKRLSTLIKIRPKLPKPPALERVHDLARDIGQGPQHEGITGNVLTRQVQAIVSNHEIIIKQDVEVERPGRIARCIGCAAMLRLDRG